MFSFIKNLTSLCLIILPVALQATLELKDFAGQYITYGQRTASFQGVFIGSFISQSSIDHHGNGIINFYSVSFVEQFGETHTTLKAMRGPPPKVTFKIKITDPEAYAGKITTFNFPTEGETFTTNFVAKKSCHVQEFVQDLVSDCQVQEFIQDLVSASTPLTGAVQFITVRQN